MRTFLALLACSALGCAHSSNMPASDPASAKAAADLDQSIARFAPTDLVADLSGLPQAEQQALAEMVRAARVMDAIYLRQVWAGNEALLIQLSADRSELGRARLHAFLINKGP